MHIVEELGPLAAGAAAALARLEHLRAAERMLARDHTLWQDDPTEVADRLEQELLGRNVISGRWTFQIVEDYDDHYWSLFRQQEQQARDELAGGVRHLFEARLKQDERTAGALHHEATPD